MHFILSNFTGSIGTQMEHKSLWPYSPIKSCVREGEQYTEINSWPLRPGGENLLFNSETEISFVMISLPYLSFLP